MRELVGYRGFGVEMAEPFLPDGNRSIKYIGF